MTDDRPLRTPEDQTHVRVDNALATEYWMSRMQTTRERLEEAIGHVGSDPQSVTEWLERHPQLHTTQRQPREA